MTLRQELQALESKVANTFSELTKGQDEIVLFEDENLENDTPDDYFEYRNDITGNVIEIFVLKVTQHGIYVIETEDYSTKHIIRFSDLADTYDKINLCELIEAKNKF
jgi:hypothetical protein